MKSLCEAIQKLEPEQMDRQIDTQTHSNRGVHFEQYYGSQK